MTKLISPPKAITPSSNKCKYVLHNQFQDQAEWPPTSPAKVLPMRFPPLCNSLIQPMPTSACHVLSSPHHCHRFKFLIRRMSMLTYPKSKSRLLNPQKSKCLRKKPLKRTLRKPKNYWLVLQACTHIHIRTMLPRTKPPSAASILTATERMLSTSLPCSRLIVSAIQTLHHPLLKSSHQSRVCSMSKDNHL